jgi:hypothetical protein
MAMRNFLLVLFVGVLDKFSESRKIRTNFKNYNFCMHSRSYLTMGATFLLDAFFFVFN